MIFEDFIELNRHQIKREPGETSDQDLIERAMKFAWNQALEEAILSIETLNYNSNAKGCGLEDRDIHDRYEAMEYGWNEACENSVNELEYLKSE